MAKYYGFYLSKEGVYKATVIKEDEAEAKMVDVNRYDNTTKEYRRLTTNHIPPDAILVVSCKIVEDEDILENKNKYEVAFRKKIKKEDAVKFIQENIDIVCPEYNRPENNNWISIPYSTYSIVNIDEDTTPSYMWYYTRTNPYIA